MFGSGRAICPCARVTAAILREVKRATDSTSFAFMPFFPMMKSASTRGGEKEGTIYNLSYVDQIYDGLLADGVRPFVELSFMPAKLAAKQPHQFWYKPMSHPPKT